MPRNVAQLAFLCGHLFEEEGVGQCGQSELVCQDVLRKRECHDGDH